MSGWSNADVRHRARPEHDPTGVVGRLLSDGLEGVTRHIEQRLDQLIAIERRVRQARIVIPVDHDSSARFGVQEVINVLADFVDVDERLQRGAMRAGH